MKKELNISLILGIRVEPPTSTISLISPLDICASFNTCSTGAIVRLKISIQKLSNLARVNTILKSIPSLIHSISILAKVADDRVLFACSAATAKRLIAFLLSERSILCFVLNSLIKYSIIRWSKSDPPRCVSPPVAFTSNIPSSILSNETSCVPPPQSNISIFLLSDSFFSKPYAIAAAVGSLITRRTFKPAIIPASFVALRCASLK